MVNGAWRMGRPRGWARAPVVLSPLLLAGLAGAFAYRPARGAARPGLRGGAAVGADARAGGPRRPRLRLRYEPHRHRGPGDCRRSLFQSGTLLKARRAVLRSAWLVCCATVTPTLAVASLRLENPDLLLVRQRSGDWNVASLLGSGSGGPGWQQFRGRLVLMTPASPCATTAPGICPRRRSPVCSTCH